MVDTLFLKEKILDSGIKMSKIAKELDVSRQTLSHKINGRREFKLTELNKICHILNLSKAEKDKIFFTNM